MLASLNRVAAFVVIIPLAALAASAAPGPQAQKPDPAGPAILTVDFRVFTKDGVLVRDLRAEEVTLRVGREERVIASMELVEIAGVGARKPGVARTAAQAPAPFVTNERASEGGRDVLFLVDDAGISASRAPHVAEALVSLLDALSPADRAAWILSEDARASVSLTSGHDEVRAAIKKLSGRASSTESEADMLCRTRRNIDSLIAAFESLTPSVPSVVVFVSNAFSPPMAVEPLARGQGPVGPCEIRTRDMERLTEVAVASHAQVYGLQIIDDTRSGAARSGDLSGGFEHVAGLSGNAVIRLVGNEAPAVKRIATDTAAFYLAAFEVPPGEQNGLPQKVDVKVARPDLTVRTWPSVLMPKKGGRASVAKAKDLLGVQRSYRDLGLRALFYTSRTSPDGKPRIICLFEPADPGSALSEAAVALLDKGVPKSPWTADRNALRQMPVMVPLPPVSQSSAAGPATYRVRVAAVDAAGRAGTIDHHVTLEPVVAGKVTAGPLILGRRGPTGFQPVLQFAGEPLAIGAVELAGVPKGAKVEAKFELAATATSAALAALPGDVQQMRGDVWMASMQFPIEKMPPGDVTVRAVITVDGVPIEPKPTGTVRKVAR